MGHFFLSCPRRRKRCKSSLELHPMNFVYCAKPPFVLALCILFAFQHRFPFSFVLCLLEMRVFCLFPFIIDFWALWLFNGDNFKRCVLGIEFSSDISVLLADFLRITGFHCLQDFFFWSLCDPNHESKCFRPFFFLSFIGLLIATINKLSKLPPQPPLPLAFFLSLSRTY